MPFTLNLGVRFHRLGSLAQWFILDQRDTVRRLWRLRLILLIVGLVSLLAYRYIGINESPSMAAKIVFIERGATLKLNDPIVYEFSGKGLAGGTYMTGRRFFKRVAGFSGAQIAVSSRNVSVNGRLIGEAKRMGTRGELLNVIPAGIVPPGYLFVAGETPDSFDSRYAESGLVAISSVIGVAHVLF